jgi:hypothetical protein
LAFDQQLATRRPNFDVPETQWDVHAAPGGESWFDDRFSMTKAIHARKRRLACRSIQNDSGRIQAG